MRPVGDLGGDSGDQDAGPTGDADQDAPDGPDASDGGDVLGPDSVADFSADGGDCGVPGGGLFISEIVDPNIDDPQRGRYIELFNAGDSPVALGGLDLRRHYDPSESTSVDLPTVSLPACSAFVIGDNESEFAALYGLRPDWVPPRDGTIGVVDNNGDDAV